MIIFTGNEYFEIGSSFSVTLQIDIYPSLQLWTGYNTRSIFKWSYSWFESFPFARPVAIQSQIVQSALLYIHRQRERERIDGFMLFSGRLLQSETLCHSFPSYIHIYIYIYFRVDLNDFVF